MSESQTVSIHIGVSRVATDFLECVSDNLIEVLAKRSTRLIPRQKFRLNLRNAVNSTINPIFDTALGNSALEHDLEEVERFGHIVLSQHALLGSSHEIFSQRTILPKTKRRVENLARIFADRHINIHLAIAPQSDCLASVPFADDSDSNSRNLDECSIPVHPWSDLVSRIVSACPNSNLIVWDFELPDIVSLPFLAALLGLDIDRIDLETSSKLKIEACSQLKRAKIVHKVVAINESLQEKMDTQYELDLATIESMQGVTLVRSAV